jgi:hypothetical protein
MAIIIPAKRKFLAPPFVRTIDDPRDPLNLGLVGHWTMDAETINGSKALDLSGRDNNGTLTGSPKITPGKVRQALSFDGATQYVSTASFIPQDIYTWSIWANSPVAGGGTSQLRCLITSADNFGIFWTHIAPAFAAAAYQQDVSAAYFSAKAVTTLSAGIWWHLCATWDSINLRFYVNGNLEATTAVSSVKNNTGTLYLATNVSNDYYFSGSVDDVRFYTRVLTPAEVFQLYADPARDRVPYQTRGRVKGPTGAASITGTLAVTEANDTIAAVGRVAVGGTLAVTEQADTIAAAGAVRVAGTLASTEQPDTLSATGTVAALGAITGTLSALQAVQTLIATGQIRVSGGLNVSQAVQTLAATGIVGSIVPPLSGQSVQVIVIS